MSYLAKHAEMKRDPAHLLPGCQSIIAVALNYYQDLPDRDVKVARYALGRDYHHVIRGKLRQVAKALPEGEHRICVDSAPLLEREFAHMAGLGWFGKNTMLIDSKRGSWFLLGFLLTTAELAYDDPSVGGCGTCTKCIEACPTGAIVFEDDRWQVDARRCISYLTIEHEGEHEFDTAGWTFGCDICQEVCPFNEPRVSQPLRARRPTEPDFLNIRQWPNLQRLSMIDEAEWDEISKGSPLRRAGLEGIQRNATKALNHCDDAKHEGGASVTSP